MVDGDGGRRLVARSVETVVDRAQAGTGAPDRGGGNGQPVYLVDDLVELDRAHCANVCAQLR